ncbi:MAG: hypothetical protein R3F65_05150 [bacterium]|nr:hypothetical protein [Myxococcales bacterium]
MSDPVALDPEALGQLDDQQWRRLGVTQTFDRLLVEAAATSPGAPESVRDHAGRNLTGGAARFWELSFPQMKRDLTRKRVLAERDGALGLHPEFAERLDRLLVGIESGISRVEPTPGVTLEDLTARAAEREKRDKAQKSTRRPKSETAAKKPTKKKAADESAPTRRKSAPKEQAIALGAPAPTPTVAPPKKLFTTRTVNTLLDRLDNTALSKPQLGDRIGLRGADLERFIEVCGELDITRMKRGDLVELHWEGRKLSKTSGAERRMTVIDLVERLRNQAGDDEDEELPEDDDVEIEDADDDDDADESLDDSSVDDSLDDSSVDDSSVGDRDDDDEDSDDDD